MAIFLLFVCAFQFCLGSEDFSEDPRGGNKAKVVEDYLLSADFNSLYFPQIRSIPNQVEAIRSSRFPRPAPKTAEFPKRISRDDFGEEFVQEPDNSVVYRQENELMERDLVVHGHHPPPPPALVSPYSLFAIGFIGFLTLIATLQASLALMTTQKQSNILGSLGKPPGRRRRRRRRSTSP